MQKIKKEAAIALKMLKSSQKQAYIVGGYVRDMIMGNECGDVDITTNALPFEVKRIFSQYKTIETGIKHGTVTVIIDGSPIEITTYRLESGYSDSRHPDSVEFSCSLNSDLCRRDFTVNALAFDGEGEIIDLFGGIADIKNKLIRCIGKPDERFKEDALRILRALRFSSALGFEIEVNTKQAIFSNMHRLKFLSAERVYSELLKILSGKNVRQVMLDYYKVFCVILPELDGMAGFDQRNFHHIYDVWEHTCVAIEKSENTTELRLAALFHDCAKPECFSLGENGVGHFYSHASKSAGKAQVALTRLKADNNTTNTVVKLVKLHDTPLPTDEAAIKKKLNCLTEPFLIKLIKLMRADNLALAPQFHFRQKQYDEIENTIKKITEENECFTVSGLAVNGYDVMSLGINGKKIGQTLNELVAAVIEGKVKNEKEELMKYIKELGVRN